MRSNGANRQAEDCLEETIGASVPHLRVDFAAVLKAASHIEILKLYMFLLQKYKALDAATLHAIAAYLGRLCNELRLEPMMYQVCHYQLLHSSLRHVLAISVSLMLTCGRVGVYASPSSG